MKCLLVLDSKEVRVSHYCYGVWGRVVPLTKGGALDLLCRVCFVRLGAPVTAHGLDVAPLQ